MFVSKTTSKKAKTWNSRASHRVTFRSMTKVWLLLTVVVRLGFELELVSPWSDWKVAQKVVKKWCQAVNNRWAQWSNFCTFSQFVFFYDWEIDVEWFTLEAKNDDCRSFGKKRFLFERWDGFAPLAASPVYQTHLSMRACVGERESVCVCVFVHAWMRRDRERRQEREGVC